MCIVKCMSFNDARNVYEFRHCSQGLSTLALGMQSSGRSSAFEVQPGCERVEQLHTALIEKMCVMETPE